MPTGWKKAATRPACAGRINPRAGGPGFDGRGRPATARARKPRARDLLAAHEESWIAPFRRFQPEAWLFRRGFLEELTLPDVVFLREAPNLFESTPLSSVRLLPAQGSIHELANFPLLARLRGLDLAGWHLGGGLLVLLASPHLPRLRFLGLAENSLIVRGAGMVEYEPPSQLAELSALDLAHNIVDDEGMETLARMSALAGSRPCPCGSERTPLITTGFMRAERQHWPTRPVSPDSRTWTWPTMPSVTPAASLANAPNLVGLRRLDVLHNEADRVIGEAGLEALASSPYLSGLSVLNLAHNSIDDRGGYALAEAAHLSRRVRLDLRGNRLGADCRAALRGRYDNSVLLDEA